MQFTLKHIHFIEQTILCRFYCSLLGYTYIHVTLLPKRAVRNQNKLSGVSLSHISDQSEVHVYIFFLTTGIACTHVLIIPTPKVCWNVKEVQVHVHSRCTSFIRYMTPKWSPHETDFHFVSSTHIWCAYCYMYTNSKHNKKWGYNKNFFKDPLSQQRDRNGQSIPNFT